MNVTYFHSFIDDGIESLDICASFEIHTEVSKGSRGNFYGGEIERVAERGKD